eukprot:scaffold383735_cov32-Prasinocladus_malaysianus.AAC.1
MALLIPSSVSSRPQSRACPTNERRRWDDDYAHHKCMLLPTCRLPHLTTSEDLEDLGLHYMICHRNTGILSDAPHRRNMIMFSFCQRVYQSITCRQCRWLRILRANGSARLKPLQPALDFRVGLKTMPVLQFSISTTTAAVVRAQTACLPKNWPASPPCNGACILRG